MPMIGLTSSGRRHQGMVVPIHWGTFDLGLHGWREPIRTFAAAAQARGHRWAAPAPGGSIEPGSKEPREPWWD
ncbi:MAG: hypothetical protein ACLFVJ_14685 [Persicimonas sp.]